MAVGWYSDHAFQSIDDDLLEAASIEGASPWQQFIRIRVPLIIPVIGMVAILTFVANFNAFDVVFAMETPNGAPDYATDLIGTLFYRYGVAGQHPVGIPEPGVGSAISTTIFVMLLTACDDNTDTFGGSVMPGTDEPEVSQSLFDVTTRSVSIGAIVANTSECFLGRVTDPETFSTTTCAAIGSPPGIWSH